MAAVPDLDSDVFFGSADAELPDWREESPDDNNPTTADEDDDNSGLLAELYGYSSEWFGPETEQH